MFDLINRGNLPTAVEDEFQNLVSKLRAVFLAEHNEDGTHITADRIAALFLKFTAQTIATATATKLTFEYPPTYGNHKNGGYDTQIQAGEASILQPDSSGALTVILPPENGLYLISANVEWGGTTNKARVSIYDRNKALNIASQEATGTAGNEIYFSNVSVVVPFDTANKLGYQVEVYHTAGVDMDVETTTGQSWVQITKIGD
jgi:2-phospho-L-lactate guanylyltransferase (CobY/MobA/RfbA family)